MSDTKQPISAIVAVFNGEPYLAQALESILKQTRPVDEILVVDDGSTDGTASLARRFERIRYIHQSHSGQAAAINRGIAAARGRFLCFLDADDLWIPEKTAWQIEAFRTDPSLDLVFGYARQFIDPDAKRRYELLKEREILKAPLHTAALIRRDAFDRIGGFDRRWKIGSIVDWSTRVRDAGLKIRTLEQVVYLRRLHDTNLGTDTAAAQEDYLRVIKTVLDRRRENLTDPR
jgi:glycosyltransferase involved in cell wall biosynthesis